jgi:uncharacterized protein YegP (UPF0339 family)
MMVPESSRYLTTSGDTVEVYCTTDGWRWRRRSANNRIVADGGESYSRKDSALRAARRSNPPATVPEAVVPAAVAQPQDPDLHGRWSP